MFYFNLKKENNTAQQPLEWKWTGPIDKSGENPWGPNGLNMIYFIYINHYMYKETITGVIFCCKIILLYAKKNKVVDSPACLRSLISAIVVCCLNIMISLQAASNYSKL